MLESMPMSKEVLDNLGRIEEELDSFNLSAEINIGIEGCFEKRCNNGKLIDWKYWAKLKNITSPQAAMLKNFVDPAASMTKTQIDAQLLESYALKQAPIGLWDLTALANAWGEGAPASMIEAIGQNDATTPQTEAVGNAADLGDGVLIPAPNDLQKRTAVLQAWLENQTYYEQGMATVLPKGINTRSEASRMI